MKSNQRMAAIAVAANTAIVFAAFVSTRIRWTFGIRHYISFQTNLYLCFMLFLRSRILWSCCATAYGHSFAFFFASVLPHVCECLSFRINCICISFTPDQRMNFLDKEILKQVDSFCNKVQAMGEGGRLVPWVFGHFLSFAQHSR